MEWYWVIAIAVGALLIGAVAGFFYRQSLVQKVFRKESTNG
nr:hypothetical protein [Acholeplasma laidlawii]